MRVVSHNIAKRLTRQQAHAAAAAVTKQKPTVAGIQEWAYGARLLKVFGMVIRAPRARRRAGRDYPSEGLVWGLARGAGGLPIGVRAEWGEIRSIKRVVLVKGTRSTRTTVAAEAIVKRTTGETVAILNTHLLVPKRSAANREAHEDGTAAIRGWVRAQKRLGRQPIVMLDANKHLYDIPELVSCWKGNDAQPTGPGGLTIDIIFRDRMARRVDRFETTSDHSGVTALY